MNWAQMLVGMIHSANLSEKSLELSTQMDLQMGCPEELMK
jgi:hypothetical protein